MAVWLRRASAHLPPDVAAPGDIVRAESVAQLVSLDEAARRIEADARRLLEQARLEADAILDAARARAEEIERAARARHEQAHEKGYERGHEAALADWFESAAGAMDVQRRLHETMRERLAQIVVRAAEQVITAESASALFARASTAVETIVSSAAVLRVTVHPDDIEVARAQFGRLSEQRRQAARPLPVVVEADRALAPGSCICETDVGRVDASLSTQLRALRLAVDRALDGTAAADPEALPAGPGHDVDGGLA